MTSGVLSTQGYGMAEGTRLDAAASRYGTRLAPTDAELMALATARPELAWLLGTDISYARNAHFTNTRIELAEALRDNYTWLESDVRMGANGPEMRHGARDRADLTVSQWLAFVVASGRGAKFDIKEPAALAGVLDAVRRSGIPQERVIINVGEWSPAEIMSIRRVLPKVIIAITPTSRVELQRKDVASLQVRARIAGAPTMFPIRLDLARPEIVRALRPYGRVAIWNSPDLTNPSPREEVRMREMGVDGMIDLRRAKGLFQTVEATVLSAAAGVFGWGPVHAVLDAVELL